MLFKGKNIVLFSAPRKRPVLVLGCMGLAAIGCLAFDAFLVIPEFFQFSQNINPIRTDSFDVKVLGNVFIVFLFLSLTVAVIRNNIKSQIPELCLFLSGLSLMVICVLFSTPIIFLWAHFHGYHFDHYEAARKGGWYIFRLNGS